MKTAIARGALVLMLAFVVFVGFGTAFKSVAQTFDKLADAVPQSYAQRSH